MTQTYGITLLLLATLSATPQDRQPASVCRLETKYDPGADTMRISAGYRLSKPTNI